MFCRIYVNKKDIENGSLLFQLSDVLGQKPISNFYIEGNNFSLTITNNDECDEEKAKVFPEGFLYFPSNIEVEFHVDDEVKASVIINKILKFLWSKKYSAIASCKFEGLLIENGGYKSRNIPWVSK